MDITKKTVNESIDCYWTFPNNKIVNIKHADKSAILSASAHSAKMIKKLNNKVYFFEYRMKTSENEQEHEEARRNIELNKELIHYYMSKFEYLEERALELGIELPSCHEEISELRKQTA